MSEQPPEASTDYYIRLYLALGVGSMILYLARMLFFMWRGVVAGRVLYTRLITSLFGARSASSFYLAQRRLTVRPKCASSTRRHRGAS